MEQASQTSKTPSRSLDLVDTHRRFGRAVMGLYLCTAVVTLGLLVSSFAIDYAHEQEEARNTLLLETDVRAQYLSHHLQLLAAELRRLGLRSEVNLLDQNMEPEQSLLRLSHSNSAFFNMGVAIVDRDGSVVWSEPQKFLAIGTSFAKENWFHSLLKRRNMLIVPVDREQEQDSLLYVVSPFVRRDKIEGAMLGGIDLAAGNTLGTESRLDSATQTVIASRDGLVVYPSKAPPFTKQPPWRSLLEYDFKNPLLEQRTLGGEDMVIAASAVTNSDLVLLTLAPESSLYRSMRTRLLIRLVVGIMVTIAPLAALVLLLRRTLRIFQNAQVEAARSERLHMIGEAANLIAHEVKNSLNGLQVGLEVILRDGTRPSEKSQQKVVLALRSEFERLSNLTVSLLTFSKGVAPRPVGIDLIPFVQDIVESMRAIAEENGASLEVNARSSVVRVCADPALVQVVVRNLVQNALEAVETAATGARPTVTVSIEQSGDRAVLKVADNGPGLPTMVRKRLFEPFVTGKASGVGIGLAMSKKIADAHGGALFEEVNHPADSGATFVFTLPLDKTCAPASS